MKSLLQFGDNNNSNLDVLDGGKIHVNSVVTFHYLQLLGESRRKRMKNIPCPGFD